MKKLLALLILVNFISLPAAYSKEDEAAKRAEQRKRVEEKKKEINGSEWEVALSSSSDPKAKVENDVLTFQNGQVTSKVFSSKGFKATNYTITVQEGSPDTVWETMQTSPKEGVVFIRGEWNQDTMRGIVSQQLEGGNTRDYSFSTVKKTAVPAETEKPKPAAEPAAASVPVSAEAVAEAVSTETATAVDAIGENEAEDIAAAVKDAADEAVEKQEAVPEKVEKKKRSLF